MFTRIENTPEAQTVRQIIDEIVAMVSDSTVLKWLLVLVIVGFLISILGKALSTAVRGVLSIGAGLLGLWILVPLWGQLGL